MQTMTASERENLAARHDGSQEVPAFASGLAFGIPAYQALALALALAVALTYSHILKHSRK